jgi:hypothetical protein
MSKMKLLILVLSIACLSQACATRKLVPMSSRADGFEKAKVRGSLPETKAPKLYTKHEEINIVPIEKPNETGSLFRLDDGRNYLFSSDEPMTVGRQLVIHTVSARKMPAKDPKKPADDKEANDELLKAFPELEPSEADRPLLDRFTMKVTHRLENGDAVALLTRQSTTEADANTIAIQARIPYQRYISKERLTTDDLVDVEWLEHTNKEMIERRSSGWEDEYTVRLSGFEEAKSRSALALEDKRKALIDIRDQLKTRYKSLNQEREQMSKQRDDLLAKSQKEAAELEETKKKMAEQESELEKYKKAEEEAKAKEDEEKSKETPENASAK